LDAHHTGEGFLAWKCFFWNGLRGASQELSTGGGDRVPAVPLRGDQGARVEEAGEPKCAGKGFSLICVLCFMSPKASGGFLVIIGENPKDSGLRCGLWDSSSEGEDLLIGLEGLEDL